MKLAVFSILIFHGAFLAFGWIAQNRALLRLDADGYFGLALALTLLLVGLWLIWRARKPSAWDFPRITREERQARLKRRQKDYESLPPGQL